MVEREAQCEAEFDVVAQKVNIRQNLSGQDTFRHGSSPFNIKNQQKIQVLSAFRPYLCILRSYNVEHFHHEPVSFRIEHFRRTLFVSLVLLSASLLVFLSIWHLVENIWKGIGEFATLLAVMLTMIQLFITGIIIMRKSKKISETIDNLQRNVDERKIFRANCKLLCIVCVFDFSSFHDCFYHFH